MDAAQLQPELALDAPAAFHAPACSALLADALREQAIHHARLAADLEAALRSGARPSNETLAAAMCLANAVAGEAFVAIDDSNRLDWLESQFPFLSLIALKIDHETRGTGHGVRAAIDASAAKPSPQNVRCGGTAAKDSENKEEADRRLPPTPCSHL